MPDLLLELFSEEIPARMQARAAEDLRKLVTDRLVGAGLAYEGAKAFATPRRLALAVQGVPVRQPDVKEEKKGPRVGAPDGAIQGFLKAAGLKSIAEAKVQPDKKGDFYVAVIEKPGRPAIEVIGEIVPEVVKAFPWPKSMRWGEQSAKPGALGWVRPLHSIVATFGPETEEPDVVRVRGRRHRGRRRDPRPPLPGAGAVQGAPARRLRGEAREGQGRARPGSGARRSSSPTPRTSPSRRATSWSRTPGCWPRSPGWSNGRWC